jgi:DNA-binding NarL/FixJ family response regulator
MVMHAVQGERMPISVAIVEDNPDFRLGASLILKTSPGYQVVGEFGSAEDFLEKFDNIHPDVVLMDISLPGITGIEATKQIKEANSRVQIVILTVHEDDETVFRAICAGAIGYVTKPVLPASLLEAVDFAFGGGTPMSPHIARRVLTMFREFHPPQKADYQLTEREIRVLERLVEGDDYKQIADALYISLFTVRAHLRNIYDKLHVHSKSQAVAKALQERLIPTK